MQMKKDKSLHIQTKLTIKNNSQFLFFQNYIISVIYNQLQFYNIKSFKREFILKPIKKCDLCDYDNFKLLYTENKNLYLLAYEHYEHSFNSKLGIFKLKIKERAIEKIAYFTGAIFFDLKNNKVYIGILIQLLVMIF